MSNLKLAVKLIVFFLLIVSCSDNREEQETINIEENTVEAIDLGQILGEMEYITIDIPTDKPLLGRVQKLIFADNMMFISDYRSIHWFDLSGRNLGTLARYGRGHGEYMGIQDFEVYDNLLYILDNSKKVSVYDLEGLCLKSQIIEFYPASLHILSKDKLLLTSAYQSDVDKFHLFSTESLMSEGSFNPINKSEITWRHFRGQRNFFTVGNELLFNEPMNNIIYKLSDDSLRIKYKFNLLGRNAPEQFWLNEYESIMDISLKANENKYCYGIPNFAEIGDNLLLTYTDSGKFRICHYNRKEKYSAQSDKIQIKDLELIVSLEDCILAFNDDRTPAIVISAEGLSEDIKQKKLHVDADYDDIIICVNKL